MIDLNELTHDLYNAAENLVRAKAEMLDAAEKVITAKISLDDVEADLTAAGIEGKNAEERKANLRHVTSPHRETLEQAEKAERARRYDLEVAQINLDQMRYRLRIAELISKTGE